MSSNENTQAPPPHTSLTMALGAEYADMHVVVDDHRFPVNKMIVCGFSETIKTAMEVDMEEKRTNEFVIRHPTANKENVEALLSAMYTKWKAGKMDAHVADMLVLAHYLMCKRVSDMCNDEIERILTPSTFWPITCAVASIGDDGLMTFCREMAQSPRFRGAILTDDGRSACTTHPTIFFDIVAAVFKKDDETHGHRGHLCSYCTTRRVPSGQRFHCAMCGERDDVW